MRYWAIPRTEGLTHRLGGLEKDFVTRAISTDPANHEKMVYVRKAKIEKIANDIPELEVLCDADADTLLVGWGGTYGHLYTAAQGAVQGGPQGGVCPFPLHKPAAPQHPRSAFALQRR